MSKTPKNAPCPCGSGRKYKKCCLGKESEVSKATAQETPEPQTPESSHSDQRKPVVPSGLGVDDMNPFTYGVGNPKQDEFWGRFSEAPDFQAKAEIFRQGLAEEDLWDDELAFELMEALAESLDQEEPGLQYELWGTLFHELREKQPSIFAIGEGYYRSTLMQLAIAARADDDLREHLLSFARIAGEFPDMFNKHIDAFRYREDRALLLEALTLAWESYKEKSGNSVSWARFEAAQDVLRCRLFLAIEANDSPKDVVKQFFAEHAADLEEIREKHVWDMVECLLGEKEREWSLDDFKFTPRSKRRRSFFDDEQDEYEPEDQAEDNLVDLGYEFMGELYRTEGVPLARVDLARAAIIKYLLMRFHGDLKEQRGLFALSPKKKKKRGKKRAPAQEKRHRLCPDLVTLERFLFTEHAFAFSDLGPFRAFAFVEFLPSWLRFLEDRGLLTAEERAKHLQSWAPLHKQLQRHADKHEYDPLLSDVLQRIKQAFGETTESG